MKNVKNGIVGTLGIALLCIVLYGCMTVDLVSDSAEPVMMSGAPDQDYSVVRSFEVSHKGWFTLYDLVTIENPQIQKTIENELKRSGGDAVINVKIVGQTTITDSLVPLGMTLAGYALGMAIAPDTYTGITYGSAIGSIAGSMLSSRTYTISGDVIRYRD